MNKKREKNNFRSPPLGAFPNSSQAPFLGIDFSIAFQKSKIVYVRRKEFISQSLVGSLVIENVTRAMKSTLASN